MGELRDATGRFRKGQTGNAGGRPRGLAATVRETCDLDALLGVLLSIMTDTSARAADRIRSAELLLDRGWSKAPTFAPVEGADPLEQSELDRAILDVIEQLRGRATATPETN